MIGQMSDWKATLRDGAKLAAEGLQDAGQTLREAASQAGKTVGIGVGHIRVVGERRARWGSDYRGAIILEPTEPLEASRLTIEVFAQRKRLAVEKLARRRVATTHEVIARNEVELDGARTYRGERVPFTIAIPDPTQPTVTVDGLLGQAVRAAQAFQAASELSLRWWLVATLHLPWRRSLRKKAELAVDRR